MVNKSSLSPDQLYALEGLQTEVTTEYLDARYIVEKLNKIFYGEAVFTYAPISKAK